MERRFSCNEDLQGLKVLYIEDEKVIRDSLSKFLSRRLCNLITASDGAEGIAKFKEDMPDIVITDIRMPIMNGLDMIEQIRRISPDIPIIITTAHSDEEFYQRAIDLSVDKYIKKPISLRDLMNIMTRCARIILQQRTLEAQGRLIEKILDVSQNFMIIANGCTITYVNKPLLAFARCEDIDEFNNKFPELTGILMDNENTFYYNKKMTEWVEFAAGCEDKSRLLVYMRGSGVVSGEAFVYIMQVNKFPGSANVLISFSDVTNIEKEKLHYKELAQYDELTKIYNRKKFNDELEKEIDKTTRYGRPLAMAMFDVDHFKVVNDTYGHLIGDIVLKEIVNIVSRSIRKSDTFARYGGEEFSLIMPETQLNAAVDTVERIRYSIEKYSFEQAGRVTCSFGVAAFHPGEDSAESFVKRSDDALYKAKNTGRNKVEFL